VNSFGEYIGCISEKDILKAAVPEYMKSIYNTSFMADFGHIINHLSGILDEQAVKFIDKKYPTLKPGDTLSYAADLLYRTDRIILPVVEGNVLLGWVSRIDILSAALDDDAGEEMSR
jgi:predicted transcriptional regulator